MTYDEAPRFIQWAMHIRSGWLGSLIAGLYFRYPVCCILQYAWDDLRGIKLNAEHRRETCGNYRHRGYVPCTYHIRKEHQHERSTQAGHRHRARIRMGGVDRTRRG